MSKPDLQYPTWRFKLLLINCVLIAPLSAYLLYRFGRWQFIDFPSFYYGTKSAFELSVSPYGADLSGLSGGDYVHTFLYPPQSLLFFWPFTQFEYTIAGTLLAVLSLGLFILCLNMIVRVLIEPAHRNMLMVGGCVLVIYLSQGLRSNIYHGQINVVVLYCICSAWVLMRKSLHAGAGIGIAIAGLIKIHPLLLILPILILRQYRVVGWLLATVGLLTVIAYLLLPLEVWAGFLRVVFSAGYESKAAGIIDSLDIQNMSLLGAMKRLFGEFPTIGKVSYYFTALLIVGLSSAVVWKAKTIDAIFMTFLPVMVLLSPLSWEHHLVYLTPVFLIFLTAAVSGRRWIETAIGACAFLICFTYKIPQMFLNVSAFTIAVLVIWALVCWRTYMLVPSKYDTSALPNLAK